MASQEGISQNQTVSPDTDARLETHSLGDTLAYLPECSVLHDLVGKAGTAYLLGRSGLHTLFAPRNEALNDVRAQDLDAFLRRHLVAGGSEVSDLHHCQTIKTESGDVLPVSYENGILKIGPATVVRSDVPCTNGFIHIIDRTLL